MQDTNKRKLILLLIFIILFLTAIFFAVFFWGKIDDLKNRFFQKPAENIAKQDPRQLAYADIEKNNLDGAIENLKILTSGDDKNKAIDLILLANLCFSKGDYISAKNYADKASGLAPENPAPYLTLARISSATHKTDEVITNGLKALELIEKDSSIEAEKRKAMQDEIYSMLSSAYARQGDSKNAQKYYDLGPKTQFGPNNAKNKMPPKQ